MKITLSSVSPIKKFQFTYLKSEIIELFTIAKELKFDGIDYCATIPDTFSPPYRIISLSKYFQMPILGIHAPLHFLLYTPPLFYNKLVKLFKFFPDAKVYNFHLSGFIHPLQNNGNQLNEFLGLAKKNNLPLSFESNPDDLFILKYYPKATILPDIFAKYCIDNNLPITFDTSHIAHLNYDIVEFFQKYQKHIKLIHLSDSIGSTQHLPLGKGQLPIKKLLQAIKKSNFNQIITFEICNFPKTASIQEKTETIKDSLKMLQTYAL